MEALNLYCKFLITGNSLYTSLLEEKAVRALPRVMATDFSLRINKKTAIELIREGDERVMCKEYGEDDDWVGLVADDFNEDDTLDDDYVTFELWCTTEEEIEEALDMLEEMVTLDPLSYAESLKGDGTYNLEPKSILG